MVFDRYEIFISRSCGEEICETILLYLDFGDYCQSDRSAGGSGEEQEWIARDWSLPLSASLPTMDTTERNTLKTHALLYLDYKCRFTA